MQTDPRRITSYSPFAPCRGERRDYLSSTKYPTSVPARTQISPGVWSDGKDRVFSSAYPAVQQLLKEARATLKQPVAPNEIVFSLAALDVFYKPNDAAHWIFWSDEKKHQTAQVVTRIALHQPPLIRTRVAWNGSSEYLYILANHHGSSHRQSYECQSWYTKLVPQKMTAAPKVLNLRKRRGVPGALREPSKSPEPEEDEIVEEPAKKKVRTKPIDNAVSSEKGSPETAPPYEVEKSSWAEGISHENVAAAESLEEMRMSTRKHKGDGSQSSSSCSRSSSLCCAEPGSSHSSTRSISYTSSQTAVVSSSRRSASVHSATTVVDGTGPVKRSDAATEDDEGIVTRGRASRSRVEAVKMVAAKETKTKQSRQKVRRRP